MVGMRSGSGRLDNECLCCYTITATTYYSKISLYVLDGIKRIIKVSRSFKVKGDS